MYNLSSNLSIGDSSWAAQLEQRGPATHSIYRINIVAITTHKRTQKNENAGAEGVHEVRQAYAYVVDEVGQDIHAGGCGS